MTRRDIYIGMKIGDLIITKLIGTQKSYRYWETRCEKCGEIKNYNTEKLLNRLSGICHDLSGQTFGKLYVINRHGLDETTGHRTFLCRCVKCGHELIRRSAHLRKAARNNSGCNKCNYDCFFPDLSIIGKKFGKLTVIRHHSTIKGTSKWVCKCDCGIERIIHRSYLNSSHKLKHPIACKECSRVYFIENGLNTLKLGFRKTKPEQIIENLLKNNNIVYTYNYFVNDFQFDFLLNNNIIIEVHGDFWHCNPRIYINGPVYKCQQLHMERDKIKEQYLRQHGYKLYIIWEYDIKQNDFSSLKEIL